MRDDKSNKQCTRDTKTEIESFSQSYWYEKRKELCVALSKIRNKRNEIQSVTAVKQYIASWLEVEFLRLISFSFDPFL